MVHEAGGFVDVAAEKIRRLGAFDPFAQGRAAGMLAGSEFIELCVVRGKMNDEVKPRDSVKR